MPAPAASQKAIERAIGAAKACGLTVTGFRVSKDGTVEVSTAVPAAVDRPPADVSRMVPKQWRR